MTRSYLGYVSSQTTDTIVVQGYGTATGGTSSSITVGGVNYTLLTFTASSTLTVTKSGLFDVLVVGGGASGGRRETALAGGGGGGGQVIQQTIYLDANATVTVGAKGAAQTTTNFSGNNGIFSRVANVVAIGGGGGVGNDRDFRAGYPNVDGGSGGGSCGSVANAVNVTAGQALSSGVGGNHGGNGGYTTNVAAGGGGGSTQVGQNNSGNTAGDGGTGTDVSTFISGAALFHGAGGGGYSSVGTGGTAGNSTGGDGGSGTQGSDATATNYGCGGGGGGPTQGGAGADGVVYVRFKV